MQTADPAADATDPRKIVHSVTSHQDHEKCQQAKYQPASHNCQCSCKVHTCRNTAEELTLKLTNTRYTVVSDTVGIRSLTQSRIHERLLSFLQTY